MTNEQRKMIQAGHKDGKGVKVIAATMNVSEVNVQIYLTWWRDRGCPETV